MTEEEREQGLSSLKTWLLWFKHAGGAFFIIFQVLFMTIDRFSYVAVEFWLAKWTSGAYESIEMFGITFDPQTDGRSAQYKYLLVYFLILCISVVSTTVRSEWSVTGGSRAATTVYHAMVVSYIIIDEYRSNMTILVIFSTPDKHVFQVSVLKAPMSYFETTPM